jgi:hypothetical protein
MNKIQQHKIQQYKHHLADLQRSRSAQVEQLRMSQKTIKQSQELLKRVDDLLAKT